jgi:hypothetical protein
MEIPRHTDDPKNGPKSPKVHCRYCGDDFEDYQELALHISTSKTKHQWGKKWAASYLMKVRLLNKKREQGPRVPLTEAQIENKTLTIRDVSGKTKRVPTGCPVCKKITYQELPIEYVEDPYPWRSRSGILIVCCLKCQK